MATYLAWGAIQVAVACQACANGAGSAGVNPICCTASRGGMASQACSARQLVTSPPASSLSSSTWLSVQRMRRTLWPVTMRVASSRCSSASVSAPIPPTSRIEGGEFT